VNIFKCALTHFADDPDEVNHGINFLQSASQGLGIEDIPNVNFCSCTLTRFAEALVTDQHPHRMSFALEVLNERLSYETCGSGDENFHMSESARLSGAPSSAQHQCDATFSKILHGYTPSIPDSGHPR